MSLTEQTLTIGVAVLATMLTRFLPFMVFNGNKQIPVFVKNLGEFLPPAILGMLVIYCYRSVIFKFDTTTLTAVLAGIITLITYAWRKNTLFAIAMGTIAYILLIQFFN